MLFKVIPVSSLDQVHQKNSNSNWKKNIGIQIQVGKVIKKTGESQHVVCLSICCEKWDCFEMTARCLDL